MIKQLTLIGVGLIGGSLARALRASGQVQEVIGLGRNLANLQQDRKSTRLNSSHRP